LISSVIVPGRIDPARLFSSAPDAASRAFSITACRFVAAWSLPLPDVADALRLWGLGIVPAISPRSFPTASSSMWRSPAP